MKLKKNLTKRELNELKKLVRQRREDWHKAVLQALKDLEEGKTTQTIAWAYMYEHMVANVLLAQLDKKEGEALRSRMIDLLYGFDHNEILERIEDNLDSNAKEKLAEYLLIEKAATMLRGR